MFKHFGYVFVKFKVVLSLLALDFEKDLIMAQKQKQIDYIYNPIN